MSKQPSTGGSNLKSLLAAIIIPISLLIGYLIWKFVMGNPARFQDANPELNPLPGEILGNMYKGGFIVPVLIGAFVTVVTFSIERMITIGRSKGSGSVDNFVRTIRSLVGRNDLSGAKAACEKQKGSIANVVSAGLDMYEHMQRDQELDKERKL